MFPHAIAVRHYLLYSVLCSGVVLAQTPRFSQGVSVTTAAGPLASAAGDFNQDGHTDLAIANTTAKSVSILLGRGDGTFSERADYGAGTCQIGQVITGDFNGDGKLDLLGTCTLTTAIVMLPGLGDGTFGAPVFSQAPMPVVSGLLENFVEPLTSADVNGDGIPDLALIIQTSPAVSIDGPGAIGQAVIMTGNGDGTFTFASTLNIAPQGTEPYALQLADVNGDGKADLVGIAFDYSATGLSNPFTPFLFVALGDGAGSFQLAHFYSLTGIPQTGMMVADVNGDKKPDVVFAGLSIAAIFNNDTTDLSGVGVFLGAGDGSFTLAYQAVDSQTAQNQATIGAALAPVLGTGKPDIVAVMLFQSLADNSVPASGVVVRPNNGDGTFGPPQTILEPSASPMPFSLAAADFNSDGRPDLAVFSFGVNLFDLLFSNVNVLEQIDTIGQTIAQFPTALASALLNVTPASTFTDANGASFLGGPVATSSIVSAFGAGLAASIGSATTLPLPLSLGGVSINVTDALNVTRPAALFYVSPVQINYAIPDGTATGLGTVAITTPDGIVKVQQSLVAVAPGLFGVDGLAVAQVFTYNNSAAPVITSTLQVNAQGQLTATPIDAGSGAEQVYLILYGTGIRNHQNPVTATLGSATAPAAYAGAQGVYVGEDQINLLLPQSLKGAGLVSVTLNVDGQVTNPVQIQIQ